jgi:hypothetical protein
VFFDLVSSLSSAKRIVIEEYGFGSLLIFQKCPIPLAFFRWVVDHVHVSTSSILLNGISIPISLQTAHDVTGLPIGGKPIVKGNPVNLKSSLLGKMNLTSLPTFKDCAENYLKPDISDTELLRNFLIVATVTVLLPQFDTLPQHRVSGASC